MARFVLASASPARRAVLRAAGVEPLVRVSGVDEEAIAEDLGPGAYPDEVVTVLAQAKARWVAEEIAGGRTEWAGEGNAAGLTDCVVVGCDSMLFIGGELQGKPLTTDVTRQRWARMMGRTGDLLTGHCAIHVRDGVVVGEASGCSTTTVHFGDPSDEDLDAYLATGEPLNVAGAFTLDGLGGWFIDRIEGDPSSVIGIGLPLVRSLLARLGISISDLWSHTR
ncbi:Maf family protein [Hoyosella subflava]|uniref:Nucleoside triphosphate pyrophosphatase n=1 Tax=Hoyosella subflava (strain DSM 45089 / JCM 17490 / NBRC 109087 / DQS3-9A1) TaxID=443218 RepID=F6EGN4_HOYSD|nr:nucleoside triphosphate pyrophosphatase [Hoyosella subflava]AEF42272.1 Maf-like protein [Hoyosella subflava DQS3-9A1]